MSIDTQDQQDSQFEAVAQQEDYFGFAHDERYTLPDGRSYIEFRVMDEGAKARFQKKTQRDMVLERQSGNARVGVDQATERHELIKTSVIGWNLRRGNREIPFSPRALDDFLQLANPKIVEELEKAIRKANPWLIGEMTVEDIDRELENLRELREQVVKRTEGEGDSSSK